MSKNCPCGSTKTLDACCQPFISGKEKPTSAEELMRSRYVAFTLCDIDYIVKTTHPKYQDDMDVEASRAWAETSDWQGLKIISSEGQGEDTEGRVEFIASYKSDNENHDHHEIGVFKKQKGTWLYCEGLFPKQKTVVNTEPKIGRNDPCTCGSGKKFKKCCALL